MSKYTPGPWKATRGYGYIAIRSDEQVVADMRSIGQSFNEANASLIAAAPELLEALKHARDQIQHPDQMIDEAIAKAEGRS